MYLRSLFLLSLLALASPVLAQEAWWDQSFHRVQRRYYQAPRYYAPPQRYELDRAECVGKETHSTSVLADSENGALTSARMNWGALVRAEHGERFMDVANAMDVKHRCFRASTNETWLGKGAEALGAYQWRCELRARACKPGWTEEHNERR